MKNYENRDNIRKRLHTLEITLQSGEFKGTIKMKVLSRSFGFYVLSAFDPETISASDLCENNCELKFCSNDEEEWFTCVLKNEAGEECEVEDEIRGFQDLIVKLEIVDCVIINK